MTSGQLAETIVDFIFTIGIILIGMYCGKKLLCSLREKQKVHSKELQSP